jgi:glycosyltransferase involved in cell wall biosynthesis
MRGEPLVSVVTPVYNGESFLAECIESVLHQTYINYEYIIVNNCSTDRSLDIAKSYAANDSRIRVYSNKEFVGVMENHNIAVSLISRSARYCKVVSADDFLFPECIRLMVECAESNPSAGIIGSYQLSGARIKWQGFSYPRAVIPGIELCRRVFLGNDRTFGFGTPTSQLYRADLARDNAGFYPNSSPHADTSACFKHLRNTDFGFVYQVLSYERIHGETQSSKSLQVNDYASAYLSDVVEYGPFYLSSKELDRKISEVLGHYHRFLAVNRFMGSRGKEFWSYHKNRLQELGYPLTQFALLKAAMITVLQEVRNPEQALRKLWKRLSPGKASITAGAAVPNVGNDETFRRALRDPEAVRAACEPPK